jgi:hypothetical protein
MERVYPTRWLRARLRLRDYDITEELNELNLANGELSDMVRDGLRLVLAKRRGANNSHMANKGEEGVLINGPGK